MLLYAWRFIYYYKLEINVLVFLEIGIRLMKINIPNAIIIGAIIVSVGIYLSSLNDPLANCMDKLIENNYSHRTAAKYCSGYKN